MKKTCLLIAMVAFFGNDIFANNLVMGTPSISGSTVSFSIKWDNSWLVTTGPSNWDAVWVFVKRQACNQASQNPWVHADLAASGHTVGGSQLQVDLSSDNKGVFIRRTIAAAGKGNITQVTVTLTLSSAISTDNIGVYGVEMVNVPQGQFYIGDGEPNAGPWQINFTDGNTFNPKLITAAIQTAGIGASSNYSRANVGSSVALPSTFPLGYNSFYCMKYEITTAQYVAFLNTLTYNQQLRLMRDPNATPPESPVGTLINNTYNGYRIEIKTPGEALTIMKPAVFANDATDDNNFDQDNDALGFAVGLGTKQFLSFLDWAALRPMTEFEFEKACRGPIYPVVNEYAWGTTDFLRFDSKQIIDRFKSTEVLNGTGLGMGNIQTNVNYRVGIAATATSSRVNAGATYYGILDMSGGMGERVVGFNGADYSIFRSDIHGDGNITSESFYDVTGWTEPMIGVRGSSWNWEQGGYSISNRAGNLHTRPNTGTNNNEYWISFGGRGVRTN
jgi:formylglycine-generating enzyme required for sulfatase activity